MAKLLESKCVVCHRYGSWRGVAVLLEAHISEQSADSAANVRMNSFVAAWSYIRLNNSRQRMLGLYVALGSFCAFSHSELLVVFDIFLTHSVLLWLPISMHVAPSIIKTVQKRVSTLKTAHGIMLLPKENWKSGNDPFRHILWWSVSYWNLIDVIVYNSVNQTITNVKSDINMFIIIKYF